MEEALGIGRRGESPEAQEGTASGDQKQRRPQIRSRAELPVRTEKKTWLD